MFDICWFTYNKKCFAKLAVLTTIIALLCFLIHNTEGQVFELFKSISLMSKPSSFSG